jgi:hypothetical protein
MYLLQQMMLAAIFSWWLAPLVSKGVKSKPDIPPQPFYEASPPRNLETARVRRVTVRLNLDKIVPASIVIC